MSIFVRFAAGSCENQWCGSMARTSGAASDAREGDVMAQGASATQQSRADVRAREVEGLVAVWTAAQKLVRDLGLRPMPQLWSSLGEPGL
jgi:hypothetical protein